MMMNKRNTLSGFTLVELMVVIAITAIMATIALPNMSRWIASQRLQSRADQLVSLFQFSRSEAIRLNTPVIVCPTTIRSDTGLPNDCKNFNVYVASGEPIQGLVAWKDTAVNNIFSSDKTIRTVAINQNGEDNKIMTAILAFNSTGGLSGTGSIAGVDRFGFMPNGMFGWHSSSATPTTDWSLADDYFRFTLTDHNDPTLFRRVVVTPSGRSFVCTAKQITELKICKS